jgi:hypothetical protein
MTQDMKKEPILQIGSDRMIPRHVYDKPFMIRFPDRSESKEGFMPRNGSIRHNNIILIYYREHVVTLRQNLYELRKQQT